MARGFGVTHGVASTDRITRPVTTGLPSRITILFRARRFATTGFPRVFGLDGGAADLFWFSNEMCWGDVAGSRYARLQNIPLGEWSSIGVSDESATPSAILAVINGGVHLVGSGISFVGPGGYSTDAGAQAIGNRPSDNARIWNGHIADFALYNDRLTVGEHMEFQRGVSPLKIRPQNLLHYLPLDSDPRIDLAGAHSLWTPTGTAYRDGKVFPHVQPRRQSVFLPSWLAVGGGVTGSLTVTEDFDSFTTVGKSVVTGSFTMAGATDVPSIDVHSVVRGSVDYTDVQDVLAATAHAVSLGNLAIGGSDDTFEISEDVVAINIHLDDNRDIASLSGKTPSSDSIAMVDTTDSVMIQGGYVAKGSLTVVDSVDKLRLRSDEQLLFDLWINDIVRTALIENDLSLQYNDGLVEFFVRETGLSPFLAFNDLLHAYLVQVTGLSRTLSLNDLIFEYVGLLEV